MEEKLISASHLRVSNIGLCKEGVVSIWAEEQLKRKEFVIGKRRSSVRLDGFLCQCGGCGV